MFKKNLFKKFTVFTMLGIMTLSMAACGDEKEEKSTRAPKTTEDTKERPEEDTEEVTEEDTEEVTEEVTTEEAKETKPASTGDIDFSTDDWKSQEFCLDGVVITFPISYQEVKDKLGFSIDEEYENETLEANMYTTSVRAKKENGEWVYLRFKNFTDEDKLAKDCDIYGFGIENDDYYGAAPLFMLCNGIEFGYTVDQIKAIMGEPDYYYESDDKTRFALEYYVTGKSYENTIEFSISSEEGLNDVDIENKD